MNNNCAREHLLCCNVILFQYTQSKFSLKQSQNESHLFPSVTSGTAPIYSHKKMGIGYGTYLLLDENVIGNQKDDIYVKRHSYMSILDIAKINTEIKNNKKAVL